MVRINKIIVSIFLGTKEEQIGELISENKTIYFKYYQSFLEKKIEISPFKMPLSNQILVPDTQVFEGLFGVFNDSLPDGWGKLLLDRTLAKKGVSIQDISSLERLAYVGKNGMGALVYRPIIEDDFKTESPFELDEITTNMKLILEGESSDMLDELFEFGGSSGGARPKINVGYNPKTNHLIHGKNILPKGYEHWIIKSSSTYDPIDIANIEFTYYKMALDCGIEMSESKLFKANAGNQYFGTKRFDRIGNQRLHLHSVSGLLHDDFKMSMLDYGHILDCAFQLEKTVEVYEKIFRLASFNVFGSNRDDHSKNFSFLMDKKGVWKFSPAYDLTFSSSSHGMQSTMVAGESRNPKEKDLVELATIFGIKNPKLIINQVKKVIKNWKIYASENGVTTSSIQRIERVLKVRCNS